LFICSINYTSYGLTNSDFSRSVDLRCVRRGTNYLHLCDQWTWHYKRFSSNWRRTCSKSNCSSTSTTLTGAAVSAAPNIKLRDLLTMMWLRCVYMLPVQRGKLPRRSLRRQTVS